MDIPASREGIHNGGQEFENQGLGCLDGIRTSFYIEIKEGPHFVLNNS
jgi:hypothetical protein